MISRSSRALFFLSIFAAVTLSAGQKTLKSADVRASMQEIFKYHVEAKELSPLIVKRSFKIYIEQSDPQRIYLLQEEVKPYFELSQEQIAGTIKRFHKSDLSDYQSLNRVIARAIQRNAELRKEVARELLLEGELGQADESESYVYYAKNEEELKARQRRMLLRFLEEDRRISGVKVQTRERKQKVFALAEKRMERHEARYVAKKEREHYQSLLTLKALAKSLDAHTAYFSPEEAYEMRTSLEKQFEGIGVVLRESVDGVVIVGMVKGGPAERSGQVQAGDLLVEIDRHPLEKASYEEVLSLLKGQGEQGVLLGLHRIDEAGREQLIRVELSRERVVMQEDRLQYFAEPFGDGYIAKLVLPSFYESGDELSCERDIRDALRALRKQGKILGVVLDMRDNLGGFLSQAVKVAGLFMTSGVVVISKYARGEIQYLRDLDNRVYYNGPLVVLTSKASASAAEIVAQALQDYGIAVISGDERTYGKGTIQYQTVTDPNARAFFKVTIGRYYTVSGRSTQIEGVLADIHVPTQYCLYNIGERYLEYPLPNDRVPHAYHDALSDVDPVSRRWYQKNYIPYLQKRESLWHQMLPMLKENSGYRIAHDPNFQLFLERRELAQGDSKNWGTEDLQMAEAVSIVKDMIVECPQR